MSNLFDKVGEAVHKVEDKILHHEKDVTNPTNEDKQLVYLNRVDEEGGFVEDYAVCTVTAVVIDYLDQENLLSELRLWLDESKAAAKAYLNRIFDFRKHYTKKEDGLVYFYSKTVSYPPAALVNDLQYALEVEHG